MSTKNHNDFCKELDPNQEILDIIDSLIPNDEIVPNSKKLIERFKELYLQGLWRNPEGTEIWNTLIHLENGFEVFKKLWYLLIHCAPQKEYHYESPNSEKREILGLFVNPDYQDPETDDDAECNFLNG